MEDRKTVIVEKIVGSTRITCADLVVRETALTIYLNEDELVTMICSPTHLRELCIGFLFAEGMISSTKEIRTYSFNQKDGLVWVETHRPTKAEKGFLKRHIASCCGRGRASFYFVNDAEIKPVTSDMRFSAHAIAGLRNVMEERAELFTATGGAHGSALSDGNVILAFYEDVGRHNTVDKLTGWCLLNEVPTSDKMLLFSGRVSSEILVKTARLGVPVIVSRSAPTDLALELADQLNVTVVGFARDAKMNVYTRSERII